MQDILQGRPAEQEGRKLSGKQLLSILDEVCKSNNTIMTDQLCSYGILDGKTDSKDIHIKIDHSMIYSLGDGKRTNTIESCWSILKRGVYGIYRQISAKHLQEYVDEFCYRLNHHDVRRAYKHLFGLGIGYACARASQTLAHRACCYILNVIG